uniref:Nuclear nucleic acid-binding protein C1D n=1 Tax=Globisporangium ultimum (strain ATCC 200006 / CBS 805.95 / DAOM BR144) TaxID=431595 RepID=K3WVS7_GLOUD
MSEQAVEAFTSVEQTLAAVEEHLKLFKQDSLENVVAELSPLEKAKVQVSLAYTVNALLYVFLKTQGVSAKDIRQTHVKQELERVKTFIKKIKDAEELAKGPKLVLDKDASKRLIHSALSADQVYVDALAAKTKDEEGAAETKDEEKTAKRAPAKGKSDAKNKRRRKQ